MDYKTTRKTKSKTGKENKKQSSAASFSFHFMYLHPLVFSQVPQLIVSCMMIVDTLL